MPTDFPGIVNILDEVSNSVTIFLNGNRATIRVGGTDFEGQVILADSNNNNNVVINGSGEINIRDANFNSIFVFNPNGSELTIGNTSNFGNLYVADDEGRRVFHVNGADAWLRVGTNGNEGDIEVQDNEGRRVFHVNGADAWLRVGTNGNEGDIEVQDNEGRRVFHVNGASGFLRVGAEGNGGNIIVTDSDGISSVHLDGHNANIYIGRAATFENPDGVAGNIFIYPEFSSSNGQNHTIHLDGANGNIYVGGNEQHGNIFINNALGSRTISLDGDTGDIRFLNADFAEEFDISDDSNCEPGSVMVFNKAGKLEECNEPYDKKVAGVISGAGHHKPAIILDSKVSQNKRIALALVGKVYCKADADYAPIEVGDLLTTSPTKGCAMKAIDPYDSFGSVIGKSLSSLGAGKDIIQILVTLQ